MEARESSEVDEGRVVHQSPSGGEAEKGSTVTITVGEGAPPERERSAANESSPGEEPPPEMASGPAPGYNLSETPDGSLSAEVPQSWGVQTGEDSEKQGGPGTWSYFAGEYLASSITTAPNLDATKYAPPGRTSWRRSDWRRSTPTKSSPDPSCSRAERRTNRTVGPSEDYERPPYSGTVQAWFDCGPDGADAYSLAAAPEDRDCVVVIDARISDEADREAIERLIDTFEVDRLREVAGIGRRPDCCPVQRVATGGRSRASRQQDLGEYDLDRKDTDGPID